MDYIIKMDKLREFQAKNMGRYGNFVCCLQSLRQLSRKNHFRLGLSVRYH